MPMSRIARTHLVYQFIILTLVFLGVGYYELLLERRVFMFLLVVPTFLYQLLVLSCCTELIPVPQWMDLSDSSSDENQEQNNGISRPREDATSMQNKEVFAMSAEPNNINNANRDLKVSARKYQFRNWKASSPENAPPQSPVSVPASGKNEGTSSEYNNNSGQIQSPESTKKYFFPYRQKRLEQWIDSKENSRPFKIRSWQSKDSIDESLTKPTSELKPIKNLADPNNYSGIPEAELTKRYTFPFRQKPNIESDDNEMDDSANLPPTPYWRTVGYSLAVKQEARRRRRSVSSSLLINRQMNRRQQDSDKSKDFSQSVEISRSPINDSRNASKSPCSTTFAKMKLGFVNCFSKIKRVNSKTNLNKGFDKKRSFKSMFQSRENINLEPMKECRSQPKAEIKESNCDFYPSYIPFQKERFETDVRKRMLELPKTKDTQHM